MSPLLLQGIALLIDVGAFDLDLAMQCEVFGAALGVGFDQPIRGLDDLSVVGLDEPVLLGLALGAFLGQIDQAVVAGATADRDQDERSSGLS